MKKLFLFILLSLQSCFSIGQDSIVVPVTVVLKEQCANVYMEVYPQSSIIKKTNRLLFFGMEVCDYSTGKELESSCYNQIAYFEDGNILYTQEYINEWYVNGKPKRLLSLLSKNLYVYTHYDINGVKTGEEFFCHDTEKGMFFIATGKWWKLINGKHIDCEYPQIYESRYFNY